MECAIVLEIFGQDSSVFRVRNDNFVFEESRNNPITVVSGSSRDVRGEGQRNGTVGEPEELFTGMG